jgi:AcrR family transcriptional regulator
MRLFSEQGFAATSVAQIEAAAGLAPGAGGLYHHFTSKETVLATGIERHLARLNALRDLRRVLGQLGDLRAELTVTARYVLAELDNEAELLRIMASEARRQPQLLTEAVQRLVGSTYADLASWLAERAKPPISPNQAEAICAVGLGALLTFRLLPTVFGVTSLPVDDESFVATWVTMMMCMLSQPVGAED